MRLGGRAIRLSYSISLPFFFPLLGLEQCCYYNCYAQRLRDIRNTKRSKKKRTHLQKIIFSFLFWISVFISSENPLHYHSPEGRKAVVIWKFDQQSTVSLQLQAYIEMNWNYSRVQMNIFKWGLMRHSFFQICIFWIAIEKIFTKFNRLLFAQLKTTDLFSTSFDSLGL